MFDLPSLTKKSFNLLIPNLLFIINCRFKHIIDQNNRLMIYREIKINIALLLQLFSLT